MNDKRSYASKSRVNILYYTGEKKLFSICSKSEQDMRTRYQTYWNFRTEKKNVFHARSGASQHHWIWATEVCLCVCVYVTERYLTTSKIWRKTHFPMDVNSFEFHFWKSSNYWLVFGSIDFHFLLFSFNFGDKRRTFV